MAFIKITSEQEAFSKVAGLENKVYTGSIFQGSLAFLATEVFVWAGWFWLLPVVRKAKFYVRHKIQQ